MGRRVAIPRPEAPEQVKKLKKGGRHEGRERGPRTRGGREDGGRRERTGRQAEEELQPPHTHHQEEEQHFQKGAPSPARTLIYEDVLPLSL